MATSIKCPNCAHVFPLEEAVSEEYKKDLQRQMLEYRAKKDEELKKKQQEFQLQLEQKENELSSRLKNERQKLQEQLEEGLRKSIQADFENKVQLMERNQADTAEKLKQMREKELEYMRREQEMKNKEVERELEQARKIQEEREKITEQIRQQEKERNEAQDTANQLKMRELQKQIEDQKKLVEEMKRKAEQGSMQTQGEVQELLLEEMLKGAFPFDLIEEVGKGVRGADCILKVRNGLGLECGSIIFESKRTKDFGGDWIEKLKTDMRSQGADVAVLVTQAMPKELSRFGEKDGVWVCGFAEVLPVVQMLRDGILKIHSATKSQENKGDKMHMLYNYLTSAEFAEQWKAIREGFMTMKLSIQRERDAMEKLWKAREKQIDKVLLNAAHIRGSIEGIAGSEAIDLNLLEIEDEEE